MRYVKKYKKILGCLTPLPSWSMQSYLRLWAFLNLRFLCIILQTFPRSHVLQAPSLKFFLPKKKTLHNPKSKSRFESDTVIRKIPKKTFKFHGNKDSSFIKEQRETQKTKLSIHTKSIIGQYLISTSFHISPQIFAKKLDLYL